ncbi:hypothetical protein IPC1165_28895 [Pseudomonas aeruginosa E2]|nr:hypothetical protein CF337_18055 [Pseudomonas aeruginosa]RPO89467.1 hypothetical protein IPC1165_28895 [Pseudomonas aeruginosa E2]RQD51080.1 hypothetical protein IPC321_29990 [Pseudomonas aeruginosa]RQF66300.1 hypothetical protein IPC251_29305 [Pseudomonas aeruginosa]
MFKDRAEEQQAGLPALAALLSTFAATVGIAKRPDDGRGTVVAANSFLELPQDSRPVFVGGWADEVQPRCVWLMATEVATMICSLNIRSCH